MTQEDKDLLLKDLCARLPYGVLCRCDRINIEGTLKEIGTSYDICRLYDNPTDKSEYYYIFDCKPYLFPLSSMTEEQKKEYNGIISCGMILNNDGYPDIDLFGELQDFYCINHLDYRGLIPKGLAIDATGLNIYWI